MLKILADALLLATRMDLPREDHYNRAADAEARRRREQITFTNLRF